MKKRDGTPVAALSLLTSFVRSANEFVFDASPDVTSAFPEALQDLESLPSSDDAEVSQNAAQLSQLIADWKTASQDR
jgi:histidinol-phosphate/aromatic aminotransferase/cobyric acid decarboxylase-like protein